jgi:hypothetical protein
MQITVSAMTAGDIVRATAGSGLEWKPYSDWYSLPDRPGAYFWAGSPVAVPANPAPAEEPALPASLPADLVHRDIDKDAEDVILYIGKAHGSLRKRHNQVWPGQGDVPGEHGHTRIVNRHGGRLYAAEVAVCPDQPCRPQCDGSDGPETWERRLLTLHLYRTGLVPVINGGAWFNREQHFDSARQWATQAP